MKTSICDYLDHLNNETIVRFPPLRFLLKLDVMDLCDAFPELGDLIHKEPVKFNNICNEIFFACLKSTENEYTQIIQASQVAVTIRLKSLPRVLSRSTSQSTSRCGNLVTHFGLLLNISKLTSNVFHSVWSCPEECEGNELILHYIPKASPKCSLCKSTMFENSGLRGCGEQVIATFKLKNTLLCKRFTIIEDLIPLLKLGSSYFIHTVVLKQTVAVWSLEEHIMLHVPPTFSAPSDIKDLYAACDGCPLRFIYCLASSIGVNVCPINCFMNAKINLLLSLSSLKSHLCTGSAIIHFLAAGSDTGYVSELMRRAALLADRHTILGLSNTVVETALIASSGGVCVMPLPLKVYNQKQISTLMSSIETGDINLEVGKCKLKCAVWGQGMDFKKNTLCNIGSVFGLISRGDNQEAEDDLVDFTLKAAMEPAMTTKEELQALKDVSNYIELVAGYTVIVTEETENVLRNYFLAARKEKPKSVSVKCIEVLIAVCMTSARLCRRNATNINDAVFAIWLHVSGLPSPRFAPEEYLETPANIKKFDKVINLFIGWLEQFTGTVY
ncbi:uncharacterized protein LOC123706773 [Pieris brassicae]|uniref:uncharacterized protein LOC123706773 n=1 Tax=Pieris brassicae TaxID=7116 RepID=UPI001E6628BC|nr:uncharacterized protein LOC123706773 [Pieris brassicae]